jgi:hypothetical protein
MPAYAVDKLINRGNIRHLAGIVARAGNMIPVSKICSPTLDLGERCEPDGGEDRVSIVPRHLA